jgi:hypothetical protein
VFQSQPHRSLSETGWGKFLRLSSSRSQIGKRVVYNRSTKPSMPEKLGFVGAIWNF